MPLQIVVDRLVDWRPYFPSDDLITADDYLESGYYVSVLAQARGQRVLPSVETLNQLSRKVWVDLQRVAAR